MDDNFLNRLAIEQKENWREICKSVPTLHFKPEWEVSIIPPFGGDIKRYYLNETEKLMKDIEAVLEGKDGDS